MLRILSTFAVLIFANNVIAQIPNSLLKIKKPTPVYEEYEGSIFESIRFKDATITDEQSGTYTGKLRYNIDDDEFEFKKDNVLFSLANKLLIRVRMGDETYYYCEFKNQRGSAVTGYFILSKLNENFRIYKKLSLRFTEPAQGTSQFSEVTPGKIKMLTSYFLEENGVIVEIPSGKKNLLSLFEPKKKEINSYIKSKNLRLKKEIDLIQIVSKYIDLINEGSGQYQSLLSKM